MEAVNELIDSGTGKALFHCRVGRNRSPTVAAAVAVVFEMWPTLGQAIGFLKDQGRDPDAKEAERLVQFWRSNA